MSNHIAESIAQIKGSISPDVQLVAVSKTKPISDIQLAYEAGQRHFGENKVQELNNKHEALPKDIVWHFIGHLQTNKVKKVVESAHLIHSIDSERLLAEVNKRAKNFGKVQDVLLQVHIAQEDQKFGFSEDEIIDLVEDSTLELQHVRICGLMGMATFTDDMKQVSREFEALQRLFTQLKSSYFSDTSSFKEISMGMSGDYELAIKNGSTMIRVGSTIFGSRA